MILYALSLLGFIVVCAISFYIPGTVVLDFLKVKRIRFENLCISLPLGLSVFLLSTYAFSWLGNVRLEYAVLVFFAITFFWNRRKRFRMQKIKLSKSDLLLLCTVSVCSAFFASLTFFSGWKTSQGIGFTGVNAFDGLVHVARIRNFKEFFPPIHPGLADVPFTGYHYFYDFLLSQFHELFKFDVFDLYFRHFSLFISVLLGLSALFMAKMLMYSKLASFLALVLLYLTPGFVLIPRILFGQDVNLSILGPSNYIFDPSMVLAVAILFTGFALMPKTKESYKYALIAGLLFGVLAQIKVYSGFVAVTTICLYGLYLTILSRNIKQFPYFVMVAITALLTALTFFPNNFGAGAFIFAPFLFYEHFARQTVFESNHWEIKRRIFLEHNNIPRLIILYTQAIGMFFLYALGVKLIVFAKALSLLNKNFWTNEYNYILLVSILCGFLIPTFFIQSVSLCDIGQFFAVSVLLLSFPAAYVTSRIFTKNKYLGMVVIFVIIFISVFNSYPALSQYLLSRNASGVSNSELAVYNMAANYVPRNSFMVSIPEASFEKKPVWYQPSLVSAMTGRMVYIEDEIIKNPKLERVIKKREEDVVDIASDIQECTVDEIEEKMKQLGSKFLVLQKPSDCLRSISQIFKESQSVSFYELK